MVCCIEQEGWKARAVAEAFAVSERTVCKWLARIRHLRTRPCTPKANGKAERFIRTMLREWAHALPYRSATGRAADLPRWLDFYNRQRSHAGIGGQAPATMIPPAA